MIKDILRTLLKLWKYRKDKELLDREIKFFWERREKGWDQSNTWCFGPYEIPLFILERLKVFRQCSPAVPEGMTQEKWHDILDRMIIGFEYAVEADGSIMSPEEAKALSHSFNLLAKYWHLLWW